ncbi:MAG TPA: glutathione S-transferase family protein [Steroidobacteraceae bacterium]|nr:glutathione S-transferase family protein [Steroidobacteraceae bacterium]
MLELHHWEPNTFFLKPLIALKEKEVAFTSRYFDPTRFEQFAPAFPRNVESGLHLEREGPLLVHDGTIVSSSYFMLEYISEAFPGADLSPGDSCEHYRARASGQFLGLTLGAGVSALGCAKYLVPALAKLDAATVRAQIAAIEPQERRGSWAAAMAGGYDDKTLVTVRERLKFPVKRVEDALAKSAWLAGANYSVADIDAFAMLSVLPDLAPDVVNAQATPRVIDFIGRMRERRAVKDALAMSRTGKPHEAFVPGAEPSRWG